MFTDRDKERLVEDLLSSDPRDYKVAGRKPSEASIFEAVKTSTTITLALFPEVFYFLAGKLISELIMRLRRVEQACGKVIEDLRDLSKVSIKSPEVSSLREAALNLMLMSKGVPRDGDAAYRGFKRAVERFKRENRDLLVDHGELRRSPASARRDLTTDLADLREQKKQMEDLVSALSGAHDRFTQVGWSKIAAGRISRKSANLLAKKWVSTSANGEIDLLQALHSVVASEEVLTKFLESPRLPEDPKWSGSASTAEPYSPPSISGSTTAPFSATTETLEYSVDGVDRQVSVPAGATVVHVYIPPPGENGYEFDVDHGALYITDGSSSFRFPGEPLLGPPPTLSSGDAASIAAQLVQNWGGSFEAEVTDSGGILLYGGWAPGSLLTVIDEIGLLGGSYEAVSAHENLGLSLGQMFDGLLGLDEAESLFPDLEFYQNRAIIRAETDGSEGSVEIAGASETFGFEVGPPVLATSLRLLRATTGGRITPGDLVWWGETTLEVVEAVDSYLSLDRPLESGTYSVSVSPPEIISYQGIEEAAQAFLEALNDAGLYQSLGYLDKLGPGTPRIEEATRIASEMLNLSDVCTVLRGVLEEYDARRDELTEQILQNLQERGYERASRQLSRGRYDLFKALTYETASAEGAVLEAARSVYSDLKTDIPYQQTRADMAVRTEG